ncbi:copper resistance protein B [Zhongshania arctica]|uniref:Copper resistance protein B n=1 Tax=Zhongshania arctica TaxID=3238302 RepID=A0ABV3TWB5_9GAMM
MSIIRISSVTAVILTAFAPMAWSHSDADPVVSMFAANQFELLADGHGVGIGWDIDAWLGRDLEKLWIKTSGDHSHSAGAPQRSELEVLYSKGIATYWDVQAGWRGDFTDTEDRHWFALGLQGLAPYFFETALTFYIGEHGQTALRINIEYELLITQKLILTPELGANIYGRNDPQTETGSGLADIETGLRLRYEFTRKFAPYIGVSYHKENGKTADYKRNAGKHTEELSLVTGLRFWF